MATVINDMLKQNGSGKGVTFRHVISHVEGSAFEKILVTGKAFFQVLFGPTYDVMHIHVASGASFYRKSIFVYLARLLRKPVILHVHGADFDSFYRASSRSAQSYIRNTFARCDKVLVLSDYWKDFFNRSLPGSRVEVLHNGVYTEVFRSCYTAPANLSRFLFLGRLGQRKGVYDLLEAIHRLVNGQGHRGLTFYLAGDGELEQVEAIIRKHNLGQNVQLLGWLDEAGKLEWLKRVDTILLPSYNEGLPMSILEAMAAGKIIISSRVGGIPDVVTDGENGFLIEPGDVESLTRHILSVKTDAGDMLRIAANNRRKIENEYNLTRLNQQLFAIYAHLRKA
ncbi:MAG: glycosyltransferase family 4 protein [Cytophagales bacterium]|nr:glycosyltransferase family 4 protein [Cytophagales bacterium]